MIPDSRAVEEAMAKAVGLLGDRERLESLRRNISALGIPDSADRVVDEILSVLEQK